MVATTKTWSCSANNVFSSSTSSATQYRETLYALKTQLQAAGWTLELSCNSLVASAADNLPTAASFVWGTDGAQPTSYFVMASPTTWGDNGGVPVRLLVVANVATASTTPQRVDFYVALGSYTLAGAPLSNRPTTASAQTTVRNVNVFLPWTTGVSAQWTCWMTTSGDLWFGVKRLANQLFSSFLILHSSSNAVGQRSLIFYADASAAANALAALNQSVTSARAFTTGGVAINNGPCFESLATHCDSWTVPGTDDISGSIPRTSLSVISNGAGTAARVLGDVVDVLASPRDSMFNEVVDGDTDAQRLVNISGLWMPTPAASLPLV